MNINGTIMYYRLLQYYLVQHAKRGNRTDLEIEPFVTLRAGTRAACLYACYGHCFCAVLLAHLPSCTIIHTRRKGRRVYRRVWFSLVLRLLSSYLAPAHSQMLRGAPLRCTNKARRYHESPIPRR